MATHSMPLLSLRGLRKTYDHHQEALNGVTLDVYAHEFVAVIGPSGAGKSTLIRCINRLVEPTAGEIVFDGHIVTDANRHHIKSLRTQMGMIFQHYNLIARSSVRSNVLHGRLGSTPFYRSMFGFYDKQDIVQAESLLKTVGLADYADKRAGTLSGGQMQRVGICRALMQNPKLLLADEPIASLDPASAKKVMEYIQKVNRERGLTCIVNLHQVDFAQAFATRIIGLKRGVVVFDGAPSDLTAEIIANIYEDETDNASGKKTPPRLRKTLSLAVLFGIVLAVFFYLNVNVSDLIVAIPRLMRFWFQNFNPPNFSNITTSLHLRAVRDTFLTAVVGTYVSALLAFILGILMAEQLNPFALLRGGVRFFVSILRNIPLLVWATVLIFIFGIGPIVGVVAMVFATLGFLARSYADAMNEIAVTQLEALKAFGADSAQLLFQGLIPSFVPSWVNWTLFSLEINIRAAAIMGMVGAGGLGILIQTHLDLRSFRRAMALIIVLAVMVIATEFFTHWIRKCLDYKRSRRFILFLWFERISAFLLPLTVLTVFFVSARILNLNFGTFFSRLRYAGSIIRLFIAFNPAALPEIFYQLFISIAMGIAGLVIGSVLALILAFLAADNICPNKTLSTVIKGFIGMLRAIPSIVLILMVVASLGFGYTAAVMGLTFSTVGFLTRAFMSSIEEQDVALIEALRSTGANRFQIITEALLPSTFTAFISYISISLESNIADSVSLGLVGAGGVGMLIARANRQVNFANLTTTLIVILISMLVLEFAAQQLRQRL